jgi:hypothetical protein
MNRRNFIQATAALLPAAVLHGRAKANPSLSTRPPASAGGAPADPGVETYIRNSETHLLFRMEEPDPADLGEFSGAVLRIIDDGESVFLHAGIGRHFLGVPRSAADLPALIGIMSADPAYRGRSAVSIGDDVWLVFSTGGSGPDYGDAGDKVLWLDVGRHCIGALRGELLNKFFYCLRKGVQAK